jgi:hypothetical protein
MLRPEATIPADISAKADPVAPFPRRVALILVAIAVALRLFFWAYTQRVWEDALITLQHAENAVRGLGLTHTPQAGPPLHGFTSPLSVLIPLAGEWMHGGWGLPLLRLISALLGGVSVWLGMRIAWRLALAPALIFLTGAYLAIEHHQLLFGMAGMETQVVVSVLLFSFYTLFDLDPRRVGIGLGLCMLARPDLCFWVAIALVLTAWRCREEGTWRPLAIAITWIVALYGPWIAFTTYYYGSPIPNTILAKRYGYGIAWYHGLPGLHILELIVFRLRFYILGALGPAYGGNGTGYQLFADGGAIAFAVSLLAVPGCVRAWRRRGRETAGLGICAFVVIYFLYYMFGMYFSFGWYLVPFAAAVILAAASGADLLLRSFVAPARIPRVSYAGAIAYIGVLALVLPACIRGDRIVQEVAENGTRKVVGEYLGAAMAPDQTAGCEPLGYLAYYSRRIFYDYPGLCSRKVTRYVFEHRDRNDFGDMLEALQPDFLVLRPYEIEWFSVPGVEWFKRDYVFARRFRAPAEQVRRMLFPESNIDLDYTIFKRKPAT